MSDFQVPFFGPSSLHSYLVCFRVGLALQLVLSSQATVGMTVVHLTRVILETFGVQIHALTQTKEALLQEVGWCLSFKLVDPSFEPIYLLLEFKLTVFATLLGLSLQNFLS